ncbi:MAG: GGDEF domain-containing protein [Betaproteobacteria bacterium]|nr:GGDEF domain-containing protein [Betaproteobacteria bacterium]
MSVKPPDVTTSITAGDSRTFRRAPPARGRACLIQYNGEALGRRYFFDTREVTLGRSPSNGVVILDESVSREHAKCHVTPQLVEIEDLGSRNGTYVNDQRVEKRSAMRDGDIVRLGSILLKFFAYNNVENVFHDKIYRMATIDAGTQVFNKAYLLESLEAEFTFSRVYNRPLAVIYYDLDFFKNVNDQHGHACGDFVLLESAQVAKACVRKDDVLGRLGGEEFVVVLPNADWQVALELAERMRKAIEAHAFVYESKTLRQTVSMGVSENKAEFADFKALLDSADQKLYQSKHGGRNRVTG